MHKAVPYSLPIFLQQTAASIAPINPLHIHNARARLNSLAKPQGSLGRLEDMAAALAGIQCGLFPLMARPGHMFTVAADHGVVEEGVAATSACVTAQQAVNFVRGGGAISSLCTSAGIGLSVVDAGVAADLPEIESLINEKIAYGTANFTRGPAMSIQECHKALALGIRLAKQAAEKGVRVVGLGEMGIGNTTPSSALFCAYFGFSPLHMTGIGAGIPHSRVPHKAAVIGKALALHQAVIAAGDPVAIMAALGGLEIATLSGIIIGAAAHGLAVMVDGFIATAAFVGALRMAPAVRPYCFFSHGSAEAGHGKVLEALGEKPFFDLGLRLGEGSGAALGMFLLGAAADVYNNMATLEEAGVLVDA